MDQRIASNGNTTVWLIPANGIADYRSPTVAEINAGINATPAIAWDGTTFPTASDSDDVDDRSLEDAGNATTRGSAQFEATLNFFHPKVNTDNAGDFGKVYNFLRQPRVPVYVVTRVLQKPTEGAYKAAEAGEWISVYRFISDGWEDDVADDDSYKYAISFLTQGNVAVYTQVKNSSPVTVTNASGSGSLAVGGHAVLRATLGGKRATEVVEWSSSDPKIATVSPNGVVTAVKAGTATITATHPAAGGTPGAGVTITVA